jgi:hypothetical protein
MGAEYACIHTQRKRLLELVSDFQRATSSPSGLIEAMAMLRAIVSCAGLYFSLIESVLDNITPDGAASQRSEHRRILQDMDDTLARCASAGPKARAEELAHAVDALVFREVMIRARLSVPS